jgi:hypothetical protein
MASKQSPIPVEMSEKAILVVRGQKVMLDSALAELYGVETKQLKRAVRRNIKRFPPDFMFELTLKEFDDLRCQFDTSNWGGVRYKPMAFTEQGVAMLSSVLNSKRAIEVNILIMRAFVRLREMISSHKELLRKLDEMEMKYDEQFRVVFEAMRQLMAPLERERKKIGFEVKEQAGGYGKGAKRK